MENENNKLIVISGPSGVGKTVIASKLLKKNGKLERVVTYTTRKRRPKEVNGKDYYFVSQEEFKRMIKSNEFFEYAMVHDNFYGNSIVEIEKIRKNNKCPLLVIDVQGGESIKKAVAKKERLLIFILPESKEQLKERIKKRRAIMSKEDLKIRMENADRELARAKEYDYQVINKEGKLAEAVDEIISIISK